MEVKYKKYVTTTSDGGDGIGSDGVLEEEGMIVVIRMWWWSFDDIMRSITTMIQVWNSSDNFKSVTAFRFQF